jgi:hypothetical protein
MAGISLYAQKPPLNDGPYIFYADGKMSVESIENGELKKKISEIEERTSTRIKVLIPGKPGTYFEVPLKSSIEEESSEYKNAEKILAVSDIEGTFESFRLMLTKAGVINDDLKWAFGDGHLVINGDVFDRGEEVTACLWLIYKLEEEAKSSGGHVHYIMGNHEVMNLSEDIRYVHPKYLEAATLLQRTYMDLYLPNTELGIWLRSKNIIEKVGKSLFTHGGISSQVNEEGLPLKKINSRVRPLYDRDGFDSILKKEKVVTFFHFSSSPFWYRGYFSSPKASMGQVDSTLELYKVNRIIVGHTLVDSIQTFFNGKVVAIDVNHHKGNHQALYIEKDELYVMDGEGIKSKLK